MKAPAAYLHVSQLITGRFMWTQLLELHDCCRYLLCFSLEFSFWVCIKLDNTDSPNCVWFILTNTVFLKPLREVSLSLTHPLQVLMIWWVESDVREEGDIQHVQGWGLRTAGLIYSKQILKTVFLSDFVSLCLVLCAHIWSFLFPVIISLLVPVCVLI